MYSNCDERVYSVHKGHGVIVQCADKFSVTEAVGIARNKAEIYAFSLDKPHKVVNCAAFAFLALIQALGFAEIAVTDKHAYIALVFPDSFKYRLVAVTFPLIRRGQVTQQTKADIFGIIAYFRRL